MANPYSAARSSAGEWHPCFSSAPGRRGQAWAGRGSWADVEVHERLRSAVENSRCTTDGLLDQLANGCYNSIAQCWRSIAQSVGGDRYACKKVLQSKVVVPHQQGTARQRRIHPSLPERMSRRAVLAWTYAYGCSLFYEPSVRVRARATFLPVRSGVAGTVPSLHPRTYFVRPTNIKLCFIRS